MGPVGLALRTALPLRWRRGRGSERLVGFQVCFFSFFLSGRVLFFGWFRSPLLGGLDWFGDLRPGSFLASKPPGSKG